MFNTARILEQLRQWGLDNTQIGDVKRKLELAKKEFLDSFSRVYCETCGVIFYEGPAYKVMRRDAIISDFKYLAFRHSWDHPEHKVRVECLVGLFTYSDNVDQFRQNLVFRGDPRVNRCCDENWDSLSKITCSSCGKEFNNLKDGCYCCYGTKPWLPYEELEK